MIDHKKYRLNRDIKRPWARFLYEATNRCRNECHNYTKYNIKCLLTMEDCKKLWFRDKAFELSNPSLDRKDTNGDYTYENCRFIDRFLNMKLPKRKRLSGKNKFKGVYWQKSHKKFRVIVTHPNGGHIHCGYFSNEEEAALIYNKIVSELFNEKITINKL